MTLHNAPPSHGQTIAVAFILAAIVLYAVIFTAATVRAHRRDQRDKTTPQPGATALTHPGTRSAGPPSLGPAERPATAPEVNA